ncbi:hypothetical protein [uncultured Paraburkholderia sp.]|uniref:hypothetical protein n=1 Tax=uncultured Paraburkholderia sp. TaxID=1822466 RepID=UPI002599C3A3|nr:hypothetical protein [uncultured Paraburkholderia sp.]
MNLDLRAIREEGEKLRDRVKRGSERRMSPRHALVAEGKLLRAEIVCEALGITQQRLDKAVASGRIFSVEVHRVEYFPAFFVATELDRKHLSKVVRRLDGLTGWAKWKFFTSQNALLDNLTPLQMLVAKLCGCFGAPQPLWNSRPAPQE